MAGWESIQGWMDAGLSQLFTKYFIVRELYQWDLIQYCCSYCLMLLWNIEIFFSCQSAKIMFAISWKHRILIWHLSGSKSYLNVSLWWTKLSSQQCGTLVFLIMFHRWGVGFLPRSKGQSGNAAAQQSFGSDSSISQSRLQKGLTRAVLQES